MTLGIDASNIRGGGGVTHLAQLLSAANPPAHGFSRVVVWSGRATLDSLHDRPWLTKSFQADLDQSLWKRALWQRRSLSREALEAGCHVLFIPGGSYAGSFRPVVTMSQNLLPFEWREMKRFGWSPMTAKLAMLRFTQGRAFRAADGMVFLAEYARNVVTRAAGAPSGETAIIPHGVEERFFKPPRRQLPVGHYSQARPLRILYISILDVYKHQDSVAMGVAELRNSGLPVTLDLVGPAYAPALGRLNRVLSRIDGSAEFVRYSGPVPHRDLNDIYERADIFVFASSCENMPNILVEAMAAGLPIAASNRGPMKEVLGDAGVYFDPEKPADIARALRELIESPELRAKLAQSSFARARNFSWQRCASETFRFLQRIAGENAGKSHNQR